MNTFELAPRRAAAYLFAASVIAILPGVLGTATASAAAAPTPPLTGCNAGMDLTSVSGLVAQGYANIGAIDVNGDGFICTKPLNPVVQAMRCEAAGGCSVPVIYYLGDNDLPARGAAAG